MKFKTGDVVVYINDSYYKQTFTLTEAFMSLNNFYWKTKENFPGMGLAETNLELKEIFESPLYQALNE